MYTVYPNRSKVEMALDDDDNNVYKEYYP